MITVLLIAILLICLILLIVVFRMDVSYGRVLNAVGAHANALTASFYPFDSQGMMSSTGPSSLSSSDFIASFPRTEEPVYLMGRKYSALHELEDLRQDFMSLIWMTYRSGFPGIGGTDGPTSDRGWGCMLRCGQMVVANCLIRRHLGRDWRWQGFDRMQALTDPVMEMTEEENTSLVSLKSGSSTRGRSLSPVYKKILSLFQDKRTSPFSIHQISQMGESEGKPVGTWFGPNTVAQAIKKLASYDHWNRLNVQVAMDNLVIVNDIKRSSGKDWRPLLLFIPLRLGLTDINPVYFRALKASFTLPATTGIIGGRPSHALYFVGHVGNEFLYLDPHTTQQAINLETSTGDDGGDDEQFDDSSYHCLQSSRMDMSQLDPSIALSFYCESEEDFDAWCIAAKQVFVRGEKQPLFELAKERPSSWSPVDASQDQHHADGDAFADYDLPSVATAVMTSSRGPNVPIEIGREAESLNQRLDSDDFDDGFEFLG